MSITGMNDEQRQAVAHPGGPALVIAGAGSGKTRVLTYRIAKLLADGVEARHILAVTFTNKAAAEMKERVERLSGPRPDLWIGTFHSMCTRLLRREIHHLGMQSNFSIVDDQDQLTVLKEVLSDLQLDSSVTKPRAVREQIGRAKNRLLTPAQYRQQASDWSANVIANVYEAYQKKLFINNSLDFDDLLMAVVLLLQKKEDVLAHYQEKFRHVLIDEYQDTNHAQYVLIRLLGGRHGNVFAVGDEDQSIYSFRGAEIHNILDFEKDFPGTSFYRLQQNYRSTQNILNGANALIVHNKQRKGKMLWTQNGTGEKITAAYVSDEHEEVRTILDRIETLHSTQGVALKDIVIFYRIHALSRVFEEGLRQRGIPYGIVGGVGFYERREVKDALSYLRAISCPSDSISLKRILNVPGRGIGPSTLMILNESCNRRGIPLIEAVRAALTEGTLAKKAAAGLTALLAIVDTGAKKRLGMGITQLLQWVLEESGYLPELKAENTIEAKTRMENLKELASATEEFETQNPGATLEEFLEGVALWTNMDRYKDTDEKVTLMTLHSSKGLEFSCVFIAGLEETIFPYTLWGFGAEDLEEERRLLYVGMTRARERLFLSCVSSRMLFGARKVLDPSRFLGELEGDFINRIQDTLFARESHLYSSVTVHAGGKPRASRQDKEDSGWEYDDIRAEELRPQKRAALPVPAMDFGQGDRVHHPKFGCGEVLASFDTGENLKLSVRFQSEEHPRLLAAKYANLKKLDVARNA